MALDPQTQPVVDPPSAEVERVAVALDASTAQFVRSATYLASSSSIKTSFGLTDEDRLFIEDLDRLVFAGKTDLEGYLVALEEEFANRLSETQRDALYAKLLAERFVPFGDRFHPSATEIARNERLSLPSVPYYRIYTAPLTYSGAATEVAAMAGFSVLGGPLRERLRELILSRVKGIRVDVQVREVMTRPLDFGGMGLDAATADRAIAALNDLRDRTTLMSEDEYAAWLAAEARRKAAPAIPTPSVSDPEDPEIVAIQQRMGQSSAAPSTELEKAIDATLRTLSYSPSDDYMLRRLRNVISSRLRNVRNAAELKQLLMRDTKVGGMGLDTATADLITKSVEASYAEFHDVIAGEEKQKIDVQLEEQKRKIEERRKREAEEHAKWFEDKIRARKTGESQKTQAIEDMRRVMGGQTTPIKEPAHPVDAKEQRIETAKFGPLVAVTPTLPASTQPFGKSGAVSQETQTKSPASPFAKGGTVPAHVKVSPATIQLSQAKASSRPSVDGVTYGGPKLVGLVGELASLTVAEFRRISKDPTDAVTKIRQKIETLGQESFEKKVEGIRAFQQSPLQTAYLTIVGESFRAMKPVAALAEEKRRSGTDSLSADEIGAIVSLNSALHF